MNNTKHWISDHKCSDCGVKQGVFFSGRCKECHDRWGIESKLSYEEWKKRDEERRVKEVMVFEKIKEGSGAFFQFLLFCFCGVVGVIWIFNIFFDKSESDSIYVDCSDPVRAKYDEFCNGDFEAQIQEENAKEENYYNSLRGY